MIRVIYTNGSALKTTVEEPGWQVLTDGQIIESVLQLSQKYDDAGSVCDCVLSTSTHSEAFEALEKVLTWLEAQPEVTMPLTVKRSGDLAVLRRKNCVKQKKVTDLFPITY